jgi:hypothetical protein
MFPRLTGDELLELGRNIAKHGLIAPIVIWSEPSDPANEKSSPKYSLLDGINRLDAMAAVGLEFELIYDKKFGWKLDAAGYAMPKPRVLSSLDDDISPVEFVICANIARRHLTVEQKRSIVEELIRAKPEASNRQIAEATQTSHPTVGKIRQSMEAAGDVEKVSTSTDTRGRRQPRTRSKEGKTNTTADSAEKVSSAKIEEQQLDNINANADFSPPAEAETSATNEPAAPDIPIPEPIAQEGQDETESDDAAGDVDHHDDDGQDEDTHPTPDVTNERDQACEASEGTKDASLAATTEPIATDIASAADTTNIAGATDAVDEQVDVGGMPGPATATRKSTKRSILKTWSESSTDERDIIRHVVLEEYFGSASGAEIYDRIRAARRAEVLCELLDRLGVEGLRQVMSREFGQALRAAVPAPKKDRKSDKPYTKSINLTLTSSTISGDGAGNRDAAQATE